MNSLTSSAAGIELGSVVLDMIFDEVIDEEETMIVVFVISNGYIVAIFDFCWRQGAVKHHVWTGLTVEFLGSVIQEVKEEFSIHQ